MPISLTGPLTVRKVEAKADFNTLITFPWQVYKNDPNWVPPLLSMLREHYDPKHSPAWEYLTGEFYIAWRGDQPVGTIAAFVNQRHNDYWDENMGFFGAFEVFDDQEATDALLQTAADYVQGHGCSALRGPFTFSTNGECGILVDGFDDPPVVMYTYTPRYYPRLFENAPGFAQVMDLYAYRITFQNALRAEKLDKIYRITERNNERRGITIRSGDPKNMQAEFALVKKIYNNAWNRNWGFVPFSDRELDVLAAELGQYIHSRMLLIAELAGDPVAFILALPDMNQALHAAYARPGKPEVISLLQTLWHWKIRSKITRLRIMLMGIEKPYRNIGIDAALFVEALKTSEEMGWHAADGGWVLDNNDSMNQLAHALNGDHYKTWRIYQRSF
ncbi:MAG: N-acetyltransferase [Anaerolineae bacterium]|nr:N-acetyltransferase [Anaerolineae bacterium]